jgi:AcrR family transcriptional regulator
VARWEPDARLRLVSAAVDLCAAQGYDATTVAQIAARAGLTRATFFRHFPDKREVLFAGQETHSALLAEGIAAAPAAATPLEAVAAGLDTVTATFVPEQREFGPRLLAVITANSELQERDAFKRAGLAAAMTTALRERGVPDPAAPLAADLGVEAFHRAIARWTAEPDGEGFPVLAREALEELHAAITTLG